MENGDSPICQYWMSERMEGRYPSEMRAASFAKGEKARRFQSRVEQISVMDAKVQVVAGWWEEGKVKVVGADRPGSACCKLGSGQWQWQCGRCGQWAVGSGQFPPARRFPAFQ